MVVVAFSAQASRSCVEEFSMSKIIGNFILTRRMALSSSLGILGSTCVGTNAFATPDELDRQEPIRLNNGDEIPTLKQLEAGAAADTGNQPPYKYEVEIAREVILKNSPQNVRPVDVASYFLGVANGELGNEYVSYVEEWPIRWNPVIVSFFDLATTFRNWVGDESHWCSAFVNFCLLRARGGRDDAAGLLKPTKSAASASFRSWGTQTESPKFGDIVVFRKSSDPNFGHVGFYVSHNFRDIIVLGGNQRSKGRFNKGMVCIARYKNIPVSAGGDADLRFHSFRTDSSLHDR
jgi:uncharacterized protein (TIGR02594 family)